jgi:catechol 2,3-dioxygenase-like lactoylglutathione lyase family enzyme
VTANPRHVANGERVGVLARFGLTTQNIGRLQNFFAHAFDCREVSQQRHAGPAFERSMRVRGGADCRQLALGTAMVDLIQFDAAGRPYPPHLSPFDNEFQHLAIVVDDMDRAFERLRAAKGWTALSTSGPQRLPESAGTVTAFKFRDPDGHPLELLSFAAGKVPPHWQAQSGRRLSLGIDHSAMSVSDVPRSIAFYQSLGLTVAARSLNRGIEQQLLDGIPDPVVDVVALAPPQATPHVELLCYRNAPSRRTVTIQSNDMSATRLIFHREAAAKPSSLSILDPDGHHLQIDAAPYDTIGPLLKSSRDTTSPMNTSAQ